MLPFTCEDANRLPWSNDFLDQVMAMRLLLNTYEKRPEALLLGKSINGDELVFSTPPHGKPFLPNTVSHAWHKLISRLGIKPIRLHDARHTHASLMLKQGIHPKIVQERLGHSSIQITLDTYSHVAPGLQPAAAKRFDECFASQYNDTANEKAALAKLNYVN